METTCKISVLCRIYLIKFQENVRICDLLFRHRFPERGSYNNWSNDAITTEYKTGNNLKLRKQFKLQLHSTQNTKSTENNFNIIYLSRIYMKDEFHQDFWLN